MLGRIKGLIIGGLAGLFSVPFWLGIGSNSGRFILARILFGFYVRPVEAVFCAVFSCSGHKGDILFILGPILCILLLGLLGFASGLVIEKLSSEKSV